MAPLSILVLRPETTVSFPHLEARQARQVQYRLDEIHMACTLQVGHSVASCTSDMMRSWGCLCTGRKCRGLDRCPGGSFAILGCEEVRGSCSYPAPCSCRRSTAMTMMVRYHCGSWIRFHL